MDSARPSIVRKVVPVAVAFVVGFVLANPLGFGSRVGYWMPGTDRVSSLDRLMKAEPTGGETELNHALESEDKDLRLCAARHMARKGDPRGLEVVVELCPPSGPLSHPARAVLEELVVHPESIDKFDSVQEWFRTIRPVLRFESGVACWSGEPRS